ncbi:MAG: EamA family transporter [Clostridia bacterium]|nr:EamA family transporter [Clostridia bacterium]
MWLYWCILSTVVNGFTAIAMKKCSNNDPKRIAIMGLISYHSIMLITSLIIFPSFIIKFNLLDIVKMLPGVILQSIGFYCFIASTKYGKVAITTSIQKAKVVVTFLLGIIILKEDCTALQVVVSAILVILSILVAKGKEKNSTTIDKKSERKAILFSYGFLLFNGTSNFLNKIYVTHFENPLYVIFNYAVIIIIGVLIYCLITKNWNYIDIRKMNNKKYFIVQSLLDSSSSIFNRFSMLDGNISVISVIETSGIVVTILASRFILKEKVTWKKYIMIAGIVVCTTVLAVIK